MKYNRIFKEYERALKEEKEEKERKKQDEKKKKTQECRTFINNFDYECQDSKDKLEEYSCKAQKTSIYVEKCRKVVSEQQYALIKNEDNKNLNTYEKELESLNKPYYEEQEKMQKK